MPELPEVQTIVNALNSSGIIGKRIRGASVFWPRTIATPTPQKFCRIIKNTTILSVQRRGKFVILGLSEGFFLAVHLRMTGRFELVSAATSISSHIQVILNLDGGKRLLFHDTRKFGKFYLTQEIDSIIGALGPEPLNNDFTAKTLAQIVEGRKRQIKPLLMDQAFIAGLGNIYVDEALWRSKIHPQRSTDLLRWHEVKSLHRSIRHVLRQGIRNSGTSLGAGLGNYSDLHKTQGNNMDNLQVYRRVGQDCRRCGHPIKRIVVGQRGTHLCEICQK